MSADILKARRAIEALRGGDFHKDLLSDTPVDADLKIAIVDLIDTYEWLLEQRTHHKARIAELEAARSAMDAAEKTK